MKMRFYQSPEIIFVQLNIRDLIRTSGGGTGSGVGDDAGWSIVV